MADEELAPGGPDLISDKPKLLTGEHQAGRDGDRSAANVDQAVSEVAQRAADHDAPDGDRADVDVDRFDPVASGRLIRRRRSPTPIDDDVVLRSSGERARARDALAERRDGDADARDADADAETRDELVTAMDHELVCLGRSDPSGSDTTALILLAQALADCAEKVGERARLARRAAARDRGAAHADRLAAAQDRRAAQAVLDVAVLDDLTGALRRNAGLDGLRRELERTRRTHEMLTVAFIDVDNLKRVNDEHGHLAGDGMLRAVVDSVKGVLRSYDLIMRFGGDEFVCVLCGQNPAGLDQRFERAAADLAQRHDRATVTVGFAQADAQDSPERLIERADEAMIAARRAAKPSWSRSPPTSL